MESIKGYVKSVVFRNADNGYTVLTISVDGEEETVVGTLPAVDAGDIIEAEGLRSSHPVYGEQFRASSYRVILPDGAVQIERYLASGAVKGIGEALASRIVKRFGDDTFRVMEDEPERLAEVKGISLRKAREIALAMEEKREARDAMVFLQGYGIGGVLATRILKRYGDEVYTVLRTNPYRLADDIEGIGFKTADEIAMKSGMTADDAYRIRGGLLYTLSRASQEGNCYLPGDVLVREAQALLGIGEDGGRFAKELLQLQIASRVVCLLPDTEEEVPLTDARTKVYDAHLYRMERDCAFLLRRLKEAGDSAGRISGEKIRQRVKRIIAESGVTPDEEQERAVLESALRGVTILTGGPGTGKTTTINTILRYYAAEGMEVFLAAPTGRAAKRMSEATGYEAKTIHRLLEVNGAPDEEGGFSRPRFERNEQMPLEADCIIIDEMSMVDIRLFHALLKAVPPGAHLVLVGDAAQLPSVGPGQVLRDLIDSGRFPTIVLQKIFRQEEASDIVLNAHKINAGVHVRLDTHAKDFFFMKRDDSRVITKHIVELVRDKLPPYLGVPRSQIQVLTPMKKGDLGTIALNRALQSQLNPPAPGKREYDFGDMTLREGDKVMQIKNNYQAEWEVLGRLRVVTERGTGIFNGDMGVVKEINEALRILVVEFDEGRRVTYPFASVQELELAYVVTIHKSQGSENPAVVLPLLGGPRLLMNRNLLYTGVTRARSLVVILGSEQTVYTMTDNTEQAVRYAGLREQIEQMDQSLS
ncbi:MAG: ATP-dependent RecD-like DNA helicase [Lachnospiraceae bacterium]|nr:ATP-dependent RecD-like DNA helicase [Lachnospiraceae bacterium]